MIIFINDIGILYFRAYLGHLGRWYKPKEMEHPFTVDEMGEAVKTNEKCPVPAPQPLAFWGSLMISLMMININWPPNDIIVNTRNDSLDFPQNSSHVRLCISYCPHLFIHDALTLPQMKYIEIYSFSLLSYTYLSSSHIGILWYYYKGGVQLNKYNTAWFWGQRYNWLSLKLFKID